MKRLILIAIILSTGCGSVDWFPPAPPAPPTTLQTQSTPVGAVRTSTRRGPQQFLTVTAKGIFDTYTSLRAPGEVYLDRFTDNGQPVAKMLRASGVESVLVREIIQIEGE